ncbi:MAG TPA: YbaB/EbfC family nucleoid-associated protein [Pleomorphomonadaceae bacterium]|nr:YbaB/EbfC family nucleoid-associated protein [Pleomorphomonadaceae bacterium]
MNIGQLTRMAQEMQANMARVQQELRDTTVEATVGGGAVRVVMTGAQELRSVEIDPATVDASDVELLQDLVFAAVTDALAQSKRLAEEKMAAISGGLGLPGLPGLR